jgi:hypothetical protein
MCYYRTTGKSTPWPTRNVLGRPRPQRAEFSSRRRHGRLQRADGAVRRLLLRLHRPVASAGQVHTYQFSIKALGPNGAVLATTTTRRKFPE